MEAAVTPAAARGTGSRTMADIVKLAGEQHGDKPALRHKVGEEWKDVSYSELAQTVKEVALGLVDLGIQQGEPVSILSNTRPEWTYADFGILAAGGAQVSVYQTNSPEECHYVLEHSESKAVFVEDQDQLAKIRQVEDKLPNLEHIIIFDAEGDIGDAVLVRGPAQARPRAGTTPSTRSGSRASRTTTSASTSTRRAPPARRRAASSPMGTTARCAR